MKIEITTEKVSSTQVNGSLKQLSKWCGQYFVASDNSMGICVPECYDGSEYTVAITVEVKQTKKPTC